MKNQAFYRNLLRRLFDAVQKENDLWKPYYYKFTNDSDGAISRRDRVEIIRWLILVNSKLGFHIETVFHAVNILDQFLALVKANIRYLRCIAISCLFLSAKFHEESEDLPTTLELIHTSGCGCSVAELLRMEKCILNKFSWNLRSVTSIDFLHIIHALLMEECSDIVAGIGRSTFDALLHYLELKLLHCLPSHSLLHLQPSILAVTIVCIELEACCSHLLPDLFNRLTGIIQVDAESISFYKKKIFQHLATESILSLGVAPSCSSRFIEPYMSSSSLISAGNSCRTLVYYEPYKDEDDYYNDYEVDDGDLYEGIRIMYEICDQSYAVGKDFLLSGCS